MYRIALINMPFAAADIPSIALAQLRSRVESELASEVQCEVLYPNLDFLNFLGPQFYEIISGSVQANTSGLGDWFFSLAAFPEKADNPEAYLVRHFSEHRAQLDVFRKQLTEKRRGAGAFLDSLIDLYRLDQCSLIGLTSMFSQNVANFALARKVKERNPGVVIVMGGANCEAPMGNVIARNVPWIDFVFSGPALHSFPELVRNLRRGAVEECHKIQGVLSRKKLALQLLDGGKEIGAELDITVDVPIDYDDYFAALDQKVPRGANLHPRLPFETSRGCWWGERSHCTFCGLNGATMKYRALPPENALALLHGLFDRYASRVTIFESVDNILPREYLTEVLPHLETPEGVALFYEIKADLKEREMAAMARAKVTRIQPGIEALSTTTLKLMRKGTTSFQNLKFLKNCGRYGIKAFWNLLVGFPNEPEEIYRKYYDDLPLLTHLQPPNGVYPIRFDRFSPYHFQAKEYGLKLKPSKFYEMIYPFPKEEFENLAYFFADEDYKAAYITATARWLGRLRERVAVWQLRWNQHDQRLKPELMVKERHGSRLIYDSRSGSAVEHKPSATGWTVLEALSDQHRPTRLAEKLGLTETEVASEVAYLKQRGLVFEEDGLLLSLVLKPEEVATLPLAPRAAALEQVGLA
ncbi:MAG TPA: RiPP maturation radical SAM C-methyltransferase [Thermoanaerobaculia bacterium]|nr:RiPP maturation radical SAM C-methyltransferase [Thermoanaerobaculia bacterium]